MRYPILFIAAAALLLPACQKMAEPAEGSAPGVPMSLDLNIGADATKASYTADGNTLKATWDGTEEVSVITYRDYKPRTIDTFSYSGEAGKTSVTFTGTFTGQDEVDAGAQVFVIYPALSQSFGDTKRSQAYNSVNTGYFQSTITTEGSSSYVSLIDSQNFKMNSNGDTQYIKHLDFMEGAATIDGGSLTATLEKKMAVFKIVVTCDSESFLGTLQMEEDAYCIPYTANYSFYTRKWRDLNTYTTQNIAFDGCWNNKSDGKFVYYLPVIPGNTIPSGTKISFKATGVTSHTATKTVSAAFTPVAGNVYTMNVTF